MHELATQVEWSLVAELLSARRLLPLLGPRLVELADGEAGDEFALTVARAADVSRRQGALLHLTEVRVKSALAAAGIRCAAIKGSGLSEALYGDPGRRGSSDVDLVVPSEQLRASVEVVRELGYAMPTDRVEDTGLPLLHFALVHERAELPPVELHWRIHWYERRFARERLLPSVAEVDAGWRPAPSDELGALLLLYARDGFVNSRLATDLGAWWDTLGGELAPDALDEVIDAYPAFERVLAAAVRVAESTVGLPAARLTRRGRDLGIRGGIAFRLADPRSRKSEAQLFADIGLIDGLLAPRRAFSAFVKRQVLVPRAVIHQHAKDARARRVRSTFGYGIRVVGRYALAMARLVRMPQSARLR